MRKSIGVIGTLDTKGDQIQYIVQLIEGRGHRAVVIDVGVLGKALFQPTISRQQVAKAGGSSIEEIIAFSDEGEAVEKMTEGASKIVEELCSMGKIDGILALGGSMGTALALRVTKVLPLGMPKLILSTQAYSPAITPDMVNGDVIMMSWVAGLWGLNNMAKRVIDQAAATIIGTVEAYKREWTKQGKVVGVTSLGMTSSRYLYHLKPALEERGYEVAVFHATGMGAGSLSKL